MQSGRSCWPQRKCVEPGDSKDWELMSNRQQERAILTWLEGISSFQRVQCPTCTTRVVNLKRHLYQKHDVEPESMQELHTLAPTSKMAANKLNRVQGKQLCRARNTSGHHAPLGASTQRMLRRDNQKEYEARGPQI
ncbi:hypothetical protein ACOMHN_041540 [Nucella lapillus]